MCAQPLGSYSSQRSDEENLSQEHVYGNWKELKRDVVYMTLDDFSFDELRSMACVNRDFKGFTQKILQMRVLEWAKTLFAACTPYLSDSSSLDKRFLKLKNLDLPWIELHKAVLKEMGKVEKIIGSHFPLHCLKQKKLNDLTISSREGHFTRQVGERIFHISAATSLASPHYKGTSTPLQIFRLACTLIEEGQNEQAAALGKARIHELNSEPGENYRLKIAAKIAYNYLEMGDFEKALKITTLSTPARILEVRLLCLSRQPCKQDLAIRALFCCALPDMEQAMQTYVRLIEPLLRSKADQQVIELSQRVPAPESDLYPDPLLGTIRCLAQYNSSKGFSFVERLTSFDCQEHAYFILLKHYPEMGLNYINDLLECLDKLTDPEFLGQARILFAEKLRQRISYKHPLPPDFLEQILTLVRSQKPEACQAVKECLNRVSIKLLNVRPRITFSPFIPQKKRSLKFARVQQEVLAEQKKRRLKK